MVKEKKVPVYGQQKPTWKINKSVVKSFVGLRIQKLEHEIKRKNNWKSSFVNISFCLVLTRGVIYVSKEAVGLGFALHAGLKVGHHE